jgi:FKBP12-rapamycin complex-associated protein
VTQDWHSVPRLSEFARLLARCYFKQGEWQAALHEEWVTDDQCDVIDSYRRATELDRNWYKAWHAWALANFDVISHHESHGDVVSAQMIAASIVPSSRCGSSTATRRTWPTPCPRASAASSSTRG